MNTPSKEMMKECNRFVSQMQARYGLALIKSSYGSAADFEATMAVGLTKCNIDESTLNSVRMWLMNGLAPFSEYPPTLEAVVQLSNLVKAYPINEYAKSISTEWFKLNSVYSHSYNKNWNGDTNLSLLTKERVWVNAFEKIQASSEEISEALRRLSATALFRNFPPTIDQFCDAILAVRMKAPLVDEAWSLMFTNLGSVELHPLIKKARGLSKANDPRVTVSSQNVEDGFTQIYKELLSKSEDYDSEEILDKQPEEYIPQKELLSLL